MHGAGRGGGGAAIVAGPGGDPPAPPAPVAGIPEHIIVDLTAALRTLGNQKKVCTNFFKGDPGEDPEHHILRAVDWMTDNHVPRAEWPVEFRHTLAKWAREWYAEIEVPDNWDDMKRRFTDHYSRQGRSDKQLHQRWRTLSFNPDTDSIATFISNVRQTAARLDYNDRAVMNLIKSSMPEHVYGTLYPVNNLEAVIAMVKDLFAPENEESPKPTSIGPLGKMTIHDNKPPPPPSQDSPFQDSLAATIRTVLNQMSDTKDGEQKSTYKPPWKPRIYPKNQRGRGGKDKTPFNPRNRFTESKSDESNRSRPRGRGRGNFRKFDKSPNNRRSRSSSRPINKDKGRCFCCNETGHFIADCPQNTGVRNRNPSPGPSSFRSKSRESRPSAASMTDNSQQNLYRYKHDNVTGEAYFEQLNC
jgi:hypothetical protein